MRVYYFHVIKYISSYIDWNSTLTFSRSKLNFSLNPTVSNKGLLVHARIVWYKGNQIRWFCLSREVEPDDPLWSLQTLAILWFCVSLIGHSLVIYHLAVLPGANEVHWHFTTKPGRVYTLPTSQSIEGESSEKLSEARQRFAAHSIWMCLRVPSWQGCRDNLHLAAQEAPLYWAI